MPGRLPATPSGPCTTTRSPGGRLDRRRLDALAPGRAVRVQHRSGALWVLSTAALEQVGLLDGDRSAEDLEGAGEGIERDDAGRPTGRLFRLDAWLRERLPSERAATWPPSAAAWLPSASPA